MCSCLAFAASVGFLAAPAHAGAGDLQSPDAAHAPAAVAVALRLFPPFGYWGITNTTVNSLPVFGLFGGLGIGVITRTGLWVEGSFRSLQGLEGRGRDATLLVGWVFDRQARPGAWEFTLPFHAGYRYADRPSSHISDGYPIVEPLHLLMFGARAVLSRQYGTNALELSLGALGGPVLSREEPTNPYYSDGATRYWVEATIAVGAVFDAH